MAITTFTGDLSAQFPAGTSLEARPASNWAVEKRPPAPGSTPPGSAAATAVSAASGVLSLTGLADSTEYFVSDAAGTRYVRITTFPERQEVMTADIGDAVAGLNSSGDVPGAQLPPSLPVDVDEYQIAAATVADGIEAAISAAQVAGTRDGAIRFTRGATYVLNRSVSIPRSVGLDVDVNGATLVEPATGGYFKPNRVADYDTFRRIRIHHGAYDSNSVTTVSNTSVIFGNAHSSTARQRVNFDDVEIDHNRTFNVSTQTDGASRMNVAILSRHLAAGETQTNLTNIRVHDNDFQGGNTGVYIAGEVAAVTNSGCNVYHDRIRVENNNHDTLLLPNNHGSNKGLGAHVQIGGYGFGDHVVVRGNTGNYSGDVGIEVDGMSDALIEKNRMKDSYYGHILIRNFRPPPNPASQRNLVRNNVAQNKDHDPIQNAGGSSEAYQVGGDSSTTEFVFGEAIFLNNVHQIDSPLATAGALTAASNSASKGYSVRADNVQARLIASLGLKIVANDLAVTNNDAQRFPTFVGIRNALVGGRIKVKDTLIRLAGTRTGTTSNQWRFIAVHGTDVEIDVDGPTVDMTNFAVGANDTFYWVSCQDFASTIQGVIRRVRALSAPPSASKHNGIWIAGTGTVTINGKLLISGCEFGKIVGGSISQLDYNIDSTQLGKVLVTDFVSTRSSTGAMITSRTAVTTGFTSGDLTSSSPVVIRNTDVQALDYVVKGGTVSLVERSDDNSTYDPVSALTGAEVLNVLPGQYFRITYTVAPTVFKRPAR